MTFMEQTNLTELGSFVTISGATIGMLLLTLFKSRCETINCSVCWGGCKYDCKRKPGDIDSDVEEGGDDANQP
jgi:hypothetical protein|eukprot:COSAG06_NODE_495_length_15047_cov_11.349478_4_plen_73_part_00